jgi:hypothetical protein
MPSGAQSDGWHTVARLDDGVQVVVEHRVVDQPEAVAVAASG